jgi:hypothetical protein
MAHVLAYVPAASGAHNLLDGMARRSRVKKAPGPGGEDRISALPDGILQHVLDFLPADEAVRTCVLASRWRHIWRSLGRLRIVSSDSDQWKSVDHFNEFVNCLLLRREPSLVLDEVEFSGDRFLCRDYTHINIWIRHALLCRASVLSASLATTALYSVHGWDGSVIIFGNPVTLDGPALRSQHLAKLELANVLLDSNFLDFSACPALEDLTITKSQIKTHKIISLSVKRLTISQCRMDGSTGIHISVPNLVWLHLHCAGVHAPMLESMPSLDTAFVKLPYFLAEKCTNGYWGECCGACNNCLGNDEYSGRSLLLGSLSSAKNLELIARRGMVLHIFPSSFLTESVFFVTQRLQPSLYVDN